MQVTSPHRSSTSPGYSPRSWCSCGEWEGDERATRGEAVDDHADHLLTIGAASDHRGAT
jgi:hypothetical protein